MSKQSHNKKSTSLCYAATTIFNFVSLSLYTFFALAFDDFDEVYFAFAPFCLVTLVGDMISVANLSSCVSDGCVETERSVDREREKRVVWAVEPEKMTESCVELNLYGSPWP